MAVIHYIDDEDSKLLAFNGNKRSAKEVKSSVANIARLNSQLAKLRLSKNDSKKCDGHDSYLPSKVHSRV